MSNTIETGRDDMSADVLKLVDRLEENLNHAFEEALLDGLSASQIHGSVLSWVAVRIWHDNVVPLHRN